MNRIIEHFTDQSQTRVFQGWKTLPNGRQVGILSEPMASPLSFEHDDEADHSGPMQEGCDSCHMIHLARRYPNLKTKKERRDYIRKMRETMAHFGDENPAASEEIAAILDAAWKRI